MGRKTILWIHQVTNCVRDNVKMVKRGNLKRETESLSVAALNNASRTNYNTEKMIILYKIASEHNLKTDMKMLIK